MFFFLPIFRELHKNIEAANEMLADQWAVSRQQNSAFLRGALKKILAAPQLDFVAVSNISGSDYFEIRIHRLVNPGKKHEFKPSLASLATTFLFFFQLLWYLFEYPVYLIDDLSLETAQSPEFGLALLELLLVIHLTPIISLASNL